MAREKTFREYLNTIPKKNLSSLLNGPNNKKIVSVSALITDLVKRYSDMKSLWGIVKSLDEEANTLFRLILLEGKIGVNVPYIAGRLKKMGQEKISEKIKLLQDNLLVYGIKSAPYRYFVFREIREKLEEKIIHEGLSSIRRIKPVNNKVKSCGESLFRDAVVLLLSLYKESLKKIKNGSYNKKQLDLMINNFENRIALTYQEVDTFPFPFKMIYTFLFKRELVKESESELSISGKGIKWLDADVQEQAKAWHAFIMSGYKEEKIRSVLHLLQTAGTGLNTQDMINFFYSRTRDDKRPVPEVFEWLYHGGLIDIINGGRETSAFVISDSGKALLNGQEPRMDSARQLTVMPTFELIVPRILVTTTLKALFLTCDLIKSDAMLTMKITRNSLYAGLDKGVQPDGVLDMLEAASEHHIPQNVLYSLKQWLDAYGKVGFEMHFLLRVKNDELRQKIKSILAGTRYVKEELPGTGFSLNVSDYNEVFSILTKLGLSPKPFISSARNGNGELKKSANILDKYLDLYEDALTDGDESFLFPEEKGETKRYKIREHSKYGGKMKRLPYNELIHVVNYSILMEQGLEAELKDGKGQIRIVPKELNLHLAEPKITGMDVVRGESVEINVNDIDKIRIQG